MNNNLCVFCGSASGKGSGYIDFAIELGSAIADNNYHLVYGGASIGVMGAVADQVLEKGNDVIGVMPQSLIDWEVGHKGLTKLDIVDSMHVRKEKMYAYSDAFIAIPGGFGTLDELCEIVTWAQLKYHEKPIYILNYNGFFDYLIKHFESASENGFISKEHLALIKTVSTIDELMNDLKEKLS